ncbi:MAG: riboflavin synthase [Bacillota bacterium]|nr:riboflavin synthase [Bacillota bacterium]
MFTGIVEEKGKIVGIKKSPKSILLSIQAKQIFDDLKLGDSVATNGVCLTVTDMKGDIFTADVMNETVKRTNLKDLKSGDFVNLERALTLNTRLGGHIVSGHIDGTGSIYKIKQDDIAYIYTIRTSPEITRYIIKKGSVAIDGISLTVVDVDETSFSLSIIPHTMKHTVLTDKQIGDTVNIENDLVAKYIEKFNLDTGERNSGISLDFLRQNGF